MGYLMSSVLNEIFKNEFKNMGVGHRWHKCEGSEEKHNIIPQNTKLNRGM